MRCYTVLLRSEFTHIRHVRDMIRIPYLCRLWACTLCVPTNDFQISRQRHRSGSACRRCTCYYFLISMVVLGGGLYGFITLYRYGTLPRSLPFWAQASRDSVSGNYFSHPRPPSEVYTFTHNSTNDMELMTYSELFTHIHSSRQCIVRYSG